MDELPGVIRRLETLTASTEGEFLSLGEGLQSFHRRSRDIAEWSSGVTAKMNGPETGRAVDGLRRILSRLQSLDRGAEQDTEHLRTILNTIDSMQKPLVGFTRIVRNLLVLCSFIKIESARMARSGTGFDTLADDVRSLAERIEAKSSQLLSQSTDLAALLQKNLGEMVLFESGKHGQASSIVEGASHCLNILHERNALAAAALEGIAGRWRGIAQGIGEVVMSLQSHDIVRQQIEHARDALAEATSHEPADQRAQGKSRIAALLPLFAARTGRSGVGGSERTLAMLQAGEIQQAQLEHARREVVTAVERMIGSLHGIAAHVDEMGERTRQVLKTADPAGDSFLASLEKRFFALSDAMAEYRRIQRELTTTVDHVAATVGGMASFIKEIDAIGIEIRMIALNAAIRSAHAGEHGVALGALAEAIQRLSDDTSQQTGLISEGLKQVIGSANGWTARVHGALEGDREGREGMGDELGPIIASLQEIDRETLAMIGRIDAQGEALSRDIMAVAAEIRVQEIFDREIRAVNLVLGQMVAGVRSLLPASVPGQNREAAALEKLQDRYTMHSERAVHQAVLGLPAAAVPPTALPGLTGDEIAGEAGKTGEDFGDNVELF